MTFFVLSAANLQAKKAKQNQLKNQQNRMKLQESAILSRYSNKQILHESTKQA